MPKPEAEAGSVNEFVELGSDQDRYAFLKLFLDPVGRHASGKDIYLPNIRLTWDRYFSSGSRRAPGPDGKPMVVIDLDPSSTDRNRKGWLQDCAHVHEPFLKARKQYAAEHKDRQHNVHVPDTEASDTAGGEPPVLKSPARGNIGSENERDDPEIATVDDRALGSPSKRAAKRRKKGKVPRVKREEPQPVKSQRSSGTHAVNVPSVGAPGPPSSEKRPVLAALSNATQTTHAQLRTESASESQADFLQIPAGAVSTSRGNPAVDPQAYQAGHICIRQDQLELPDQRAGPPDDPPVTVSSEPRTASLSTSTGGAPLSSPTTRPFVRHTDVKEPHHSQAQHSRKRSLSGSLVARGPPLPPSHDKTPNEVRAPEPALDSSPRAESAAGSSSGAGATLSGATSAAYSSYAMVSPRFDAMHMPWVPDRPPMLHPTYPSSDGWYFYVCEGCAMRLF